MSFVGAINKAMVNMWSIGRRFSSQWASKRPVIRKPKGRLNTKTPSYKYGNSHYQDKTVSWRSISHTRGPDFNCDDITMANGVIVDVLCKVFWADCHASYDDMCNYTSQGIPMGDLSSNRYSVLLASRSHFSPKNQAHPGSPLCHVQIFDKT